MKFKHSFLRWLPCFLVLAFTITGCVQDSLIRFENGKVCEIDDQGRETCADLGPGKMVVFALGDSGKFTLKSVPVNLGSQQAWLKKTGRAYPFPAGHISGKRQGSTLQLFETGQAATDTISRIKLAMKNVAWTGFMQESPNAPVMMMMAGDYPCDVSENINERLTSQDTFRLTRHGTCMLGSGGLGVIVIESDIIDPTMRVNILDAVPETGDWIRQKFPRLTRLETVPQSWLFNLNDAPLINTHFAQPIAMAASEPVADIPGDCGPEEMIRSSLSRMDWGDPVCIFVDGVYQIRYCGGTNMLSFQNADGQLSEVYLTSNCGVQFVKRNGLVAVYLQEGCDLSLGLNCLPNSTK